MSRSKFNKCYTMKKDSIDVGTNMTEADNISGKRMQFSERKDGGEIKKKGFYIPHAITELAASGKFEMKKNVCVLKSLNIEETEFLETYISS